MDPGMDRLLRLGALAMLGAISSLAADLKGIQAEPDPVKRVRLVLSHGEQTAGRAAKVCQANEY